MGMSPQLHIVAHWWQKNTRNVLYIHGGKQRDWREKKKEGGRCLVVQLVVSCQLQ